MLGTWQLVSLCSQRGGDSSAFRVSKRLLHAMVMWGGQQKHVLRTICAAALFYSHKFENKHTIVVVPNPI